MREQGRSFEEAVNDAIRRGLSDGASSVRKYTRPRKLGPARADLTQARQLAARLEDDAIVRRLAENR